VPKKPFPVRSGRNSALDYAGKRGEDEIVRIREQRAEEDKKKAEAMNQVRGHVRIAFAHPLQGVRLAPVVIIRLIDDQPLQKYFIFIAICVALLGQGSEFCEEI
jgi:hypothetical protein